MFIHLYAYITIVIKEEEVMNFSKGETWERQEGRKGRGNDKILF